MKDPHQRFHVEVIGFEEYSSPRSFDDVLLEDIQTIDNTLWFTLPAVLSDVENDFVSFERYAWDGECFWRIDIKASRGVRLLPWTPRI